MKVYSYLDILTFKMFFAQRQFLSYQDLGYKVKPVYRYKDHSRETWKVAFIGR